MLRRSYIAFILIAALGIGVSFAHSGSGHQSKQKDKEKPKATFSTGTGESSTAFLVGGGSYLGVYLEEVTPARAKELNLSEERGAIIMKVVENSPAETAGLKSNDVIVSFNGRQVDSVREVQRLLGETPAGRSVSIEVLRAGSRQTLNAKLDSRADRNRFYGRGRNFDEDWVKEQEEAMKRAQEAFERAQKENRALPGFDNYNFGGQGLIWAQSRTRLGVTVESLSDQLAEYFGAKDGKGVLISEVRDDTPASKAGLKAGDVITAVDGEKVSNVQDLTRAISRKEEGPVNITIIRNQSEQTITVTLEKAEPRAVPRRGALSRPRVVTNI